MIELDSHFGGKAQAWHMDAAYTDWPPAITMLRTVMLPPYGDGARPARHAAPPREIGVDRRASVARDAGASAGVGENT
jgi:hypothetical protein